MRRKQRRSFVLPSVKKPLNGLRRKQGSTSSKGLNRHGGIIQKISDKVILKKEHHLVQPTSSETLREIVKILGLSQKQVCKLYRKFKSIRSTCTRTHTPGSENEPHQISREDLLRALEEEETEIIRSLFKIMNIKADESISFEMFVRICSSWSLYSREDILKFCFGCFDNDNSGFLDEDEFKNLCIAVNKGDPVYPGNFTTALLMVDENGDGVIDFSEFKTLDKRFPLLFFPVFRLQEKIQKFTLGERKWMKVLEMVEVARNKKTSKGVNAAKSSMRSMIISKFTKLPLICPDPEQIDALKRGQSAGVDIKLSL